MIKLNPWTKGAKPRIYVNGMATLGKVWLENRKGRTVVVFDHQAETTSEAEVMVAAGQAALCDPHDWETLLNAVTSAPAPKRGRQSGFMASSRRNDIEPARPLAWTAEWAKEHQDELDTNFKTNPLTVDTEIVIDDREPAEMVDRLRAMRHLKVSIASLDTGDYEVPGRMLIERKTPADFALSITGDDKRLFNQSERMAISGLQSVLILEGDVYGSTSMSLVGISGALTYLTAIQRMHIIPTLSVEHTAYVIAKLVRHGVEGLGYELALRTTKEKDPIRQAAFVVEGIPGVSAELARTLIRTFGSVRALANATEAQLRAVSGIGPKRATQIFNTLNQTV